MWLFTDMNGIRIVSIGYTPTMRLSQRRKKALHFKLISQAYFDNWREQNNVNTTRQ